MPDSDTNEDLANSIKPHELYQKVSAEDPAAEVDLGMVNFEIILQNKFTKQYHIKTLTAQGESQNLVVNVDSMVRCPHALAKALRWTSGIKHTL